MKSSDLQALQQASIVQASADPEHYRRRLLRQLAFLRLLAWLPFGVFVLACLVALSAWYWGHGVVAVLSMVLALGFFWYALWALQYPSRPVHAYPVHPDQAPELFRMLTRMQGKLHTPHISHVWLTSDFSLTIQEHRRWDFWGASQLHLFLGIPFLASSSPERMLALMAQEYAHWRHDAEAKGLQIYGLRRRWLSLMGQGSASGSEAEFPSLSLRSSWGLPSWTALRQRFVASSLGFARMEELAADAAIAKIYGRDRMAEALVENAIVAHHIRHEHWRQYWQLACKLAKPTMGPYAWLGAWQIKPPKARAVEERFAELQREEPHWQDAQPCTRQRVQMLGCSLHIPPPSARHAGVLLGKALPMVIKQFDTQWWALNASRWQVLHLQYQQEQGTIQELEAKLDGLALADLERLAQLYKRHLRENDAEMVYRRVRDVDAYSAYALWQQIEFLMERNDDNVLLSLAEMVERHPEHQHRAILLALGLVDKLPQTPEVQDLRISWQERLEEYEAQDQAWEMALQRSPLLADLQPAALGVWQQEDLRITAQRIPSITRMWVLLKTRPVSHWRKAFVLVLEQRDSDAIAPADIAAEFAWLGKVLAVNTPDLALGRPALSLADLGEPVYAGSSSQRFKPLLGATQRNTGPVPLGLH
ncbi:MAG: hypothetical protein ACH34Y_01545 [Brachymonas sp.]|jgi:hypothetical protein